MRAEEMNECVMNGNGTSVCRSREAERLKMKRERIREDVRKARAEGENRGMPGILLLRESSLAPSLLSPTLFHTLTDVYTLAAMPRSRADMHMRMLSVPTHFFPSDPECDSHCPGRN